MATNHINVSTGLVASGKPLALHGYDAVSYFNAPSPIRGSAPFSVDHDGATWYFASAGNADAFRAAPARYVPSFGGFCAYGASVGKKFDGDPTIYRVIDGRLHLNLNPEIHVAFNADPAGAIAKADAAWPTIADKPADTL
jgi:YHS domain-containing protein